MASQPRTGGSLLVVRGSSMRSKCFGFTLSELLIGTAIIGILAALFLPLITRYVARTESNLGYLTISSLRSAADDNYANGISDPTLATLGITPSASHLGTISETLNATGTGTIVFAFSNSITSSMAGTVHTLTRNAGGAWSCRTTLLSSSGLVPRGCTGA